LGMHQAVVQTITLVLLVFLQAAVVVIQMV
jgi:hypothetical protein